MPQRASGEFDAWPWKIAAAIGHTPVTCPAPNRVEGLIAVKEKGASWHPVPALLWSERCGRDDVEQFGERWCRHGALGLRPTKDLMAVMLANAGRLAKYGA